MIAHARAAVTLAGVRPRVLMDIGGPKVRMVTPVDRNRVYVGDTVLLSRKVDPQLRSMPFQITALRPRSSTGFALGAAVSIDDGAGSMALSPSRFPGASWVGVGARETSGGVELRSEKGLNFPNTELGLDP